MVTALRLLAASCWFGVGWAHTQPAPNVAFDIHSPKDFVRFSISDGDSQQKPQTQILSAAGLKDIEQTALEKLQEMEKYAEDALSEKLRQAREEMNTTRRRFDAVSEKIAAKLLDRERALAQRWQQLAVASSHGMSGKCCCESGGGCGWEPFVEGKDKNCPLSKPQDYRDRVEPTGVKGLLAAETIDGLLSQCAGSKGWIEAANLAAEKKEEAARLELEKKRAAEEQAARLEEARKKAAAEQAARLEAERKAAEEQAARQEAERKAAEEQAARQEAERKAAEEQAARQEAERKKAEEEEAARQEAARKKAEEEEESARVEAERRAAAEAERKEAARMAAEKQKAEEEEAARIEAEKQKAAYEEKLFAERAAKRKEAAEEATRLLTEISAAQDEESAAAERVPSYGDGANLEVEKAVAEEAQWRKAKNKAVEQLKAICLEAKKQAEDEDVDDRPMEEKETQVRLEKACQERGISLDSPGEVDGQPPGAGSTPVDSPSYDPDAVDDSPSDSKTSPTEDETPDESETTQD